MREGKIDMQTLKKVKQIALEAQSTVKRGKVLLDVDRDGDIEVLKNEGNVLVEVAEREDK